MPIYALLSAILSTFNHIPKSGKAGGVTCHVNKVPLLYQCRHTGRLIPQIVVVLNYTVLQMFSFTATTGQVIS